MNINAIFMLIVMAGVPLIFAITMHEAAHGFVAKLRGDNTAQALGRVSLNPVVHIDFIGTILIPAILLLSSIATGFFVVFGWAKPVPINPNNFKNTRVDTALVALAGPMANLIMALIWAIIVKFSSQYPYVGGMASYGIVVNIVLMVLNLLPIPPLDGSKVVSAFLSQNMANKYNNIQRYGFLILLVLIIIPFNGTSLLSFIMNPFISFIMKIINNVIF